MNHSLRIAQITDLHIQRRLAADAGGDEATERLLARLPATLGSLVDRRVDVLVLTGDLVHVPDDPTDAQRLAAADDYALLRELFDGAGVPYIALPGNHDHAPTMWSVFPRGRDVIDLHGWRFVRFCDEEHEDHEPRRVGAERELFDQVVAATDGPPQIHLQHYVLRPTLRENYPHAYEDAAEMAARIVACGRVRLTLSGHYHEGTDLIHAGPTTFTTGPAVFKPPGPWRIYDLRADGLTMAPQFLA